MSSIRACLAVSCALSCAVLTLSSPLQSQAAPDVRRMWFTPAVVPENYTQPVTFEAQVTGSPPSVAFAYDGADRPMVDDGTTGDRIAGDGIWTIRFTANEILSKVTPSSVHRPFIGFCRPAQGPQFNVFAEVWTSSMGTVPVYPRNATAQQTANVLNLVVATSELTAPDYEAWARRAYTLLPDDFDFLNFVSVAGLRANRFHVNVRNDVLGIGLSTFNNAPLWGSGGRLRGANVFPLSSLFDLASRGSNHEVGHQWINFLTGTPLSSGRPHWPKGNAASDVMGLSIAGSGAGGTYPYTFLPAGGGYLVETRTAFEQTLFNTLELYLMGLVPPGDVGQFFVLNDQQYQVTVGEMLQPSQFTAVTVNDVVAAHGPRIPDSAASPKAFRVASVVLSEQLLDVHALSLYDWFARRASVTTTVPCAEGFSQYTCRPFFLATGGRATLSSSIGAPFTDDPLVPGVTARAIHVSELRARIDSLRGSRGLAAYVYTDPPPAVGNTIRAQHLTEMRVALAEAYAAAKLTAPVYTDPDLAGAPIRAIHIRELRSAVTLLEGSPVN